MSCSKIKFLSSTSNYSSINITNLNPIQDVSMKHVEFLSSYKGHTMAQTVSCQPLITDAQVQTHTSPCGTAGGQSGTRARLSPST